ncbi:hypothetical protein [Methylomonas methanica]|uniref:Uncharacterized protein n=1 Tax=Methylomonas methanica (strain DSM 25384 / MC09) TaxID=857087 RepID=F9ZW18_METMM|nr:hypothetical protein [Methylomonas methanica]AEG00822.1 hypothetical protein Metme_2424 [Methylomonas methanica MC09]
MNAIHIDRLHFAGRESQRRILVADLDRATWPSLRDREYLFIRRLHAVKPAGQLAGSLAEQAQAFRHAAVSGWEADAERQNAVYFTDYAELLACLSRDLLHKQYRWYWRQWADLFESPVETALPRCWRQQQHLIPALVGQLAQHNQLSWFCAQLVEPLAGQLCRAVYPDWDELKQRVGAAGFDSPQPPLSSAWLAPWQAVLVGANRPVWVAELAALIAVREWQPLKRQTTDIAPVYRAFLGSLLAIASSKSAHALGDSRVSGDWQTANTAHPAFSEESRNSDHIAVNESPAARPGISAHELTHENRVETASESNRAEQLAPDRAAEAAYEAQAQILSSPPDHSVLGLSQPATRSERIPATYGDYPTSRLFTGQGGLFYLLNFLNLPQVQDALFSEPQTRAYPSAWGWLWRLADALTWEPDPALEKLFAYFCGYQRPEQLLQLPAMPQMPDLLQWGRQRYGAELFHREILTMPALVETDACHVDVFYALDKVNLDVRRVGLDIDPGWLPWLGKVVKFHYGTLPLS